MNTNQTDADVSDACAASTGDRTYLELSRVMKSISRGHRLRTVLTEILESAQRLSRAADIRFRVYSSDVAAELMDSQSSDGSVKSESAGQDTIVISTDDTELSPLDEETKISDGCYFSRAEQWHDSSSSGSDPAVWKAGDRFWFPLIDASGNRVADLEIAGATDGRLFTHHEVIRIRLLVELAVVAISKRKELSHYEQISNGMKQRTDLLEDLLTISSSIVSERSPDALSKMTLTSLSTLFGFQRVSLVAFDETVGEFRWKAAFGYPHEYVEMALSRTIPSDVVLEDFTSGNSISRSAYYVPFEKISERSRRYCISPDTMVRAASSQPRMDRELRAGDTLAFVLRDSAARIVGAIYASMPIDGRIPDKETLETIEIFTSLAEVAMEDARLSDEKELALRLSSQRTEQLSRIFDLTSELLYVKDLDHLLEDVLKTLAQLLGLRRMVIGIRNDERGTFTIKAVYGYPDENVEGIKAVEYPIGRVEHIMDPESQLYPESPVKWRKKIGRRTYYIPAEGIERQPEDDVYYPDSDLIRHPRRSKVHWHELDYLDTYIHNRDGGIMAYIEILRPRDDRVPDAETIEVIEIFASLVGVAIENSRMFQNQVESRRSAEFFTDLLSHDIKNFNQAIMGYLDILRTHLSSTEQTPLIEKIVGQVMNVNRLASDVRTISRLTWGGMTLARVDLGAALIDSVHNVKMYFLTKEIEITMDNVEAQRFFVNADELMRELFSNILTNAVKYDAHETVRIGVSVSRESEGNHRWVIVSISDQGCGVPDDMKEAIFERFSKGVKQKGSSGLGLHIVDMLARRYKGKVWVENRVKGNKDEGSVFKVRLPEY